MKPIQLPLSKNSDPLLFSPTQVEITVLGQSEDDANCVRMQIRMIETTESGSIVETRVVSFSKTLVDGIFSGYDSAGGEPMVSIDAISKLLLSINIIIKK